MTVEDYRQFVKTYKIRQVDIAWIMGVSQRQVRRWAAGEAPIPRPLYLILLALGQERITPTWLKMHISEPIPYLPQDRN